MPAYVATIEVFFETYDPPYAWVFADALADCVTEYDATAHLNTEMRHPVRVSAVTSNVAPDEPKPKPFASLVGRLRDGTLT